jgi:putative transposase
MTTVRYVERNPVVARLCRKPQDWKWSSALAHLRGEDNQLVRVKPMMDRVGNWSAY